MQRIITLEMGNEFHTKGEQKVENYVKKTKL